MNYNPNSLQLPSHKKQVDHAQNCWHFSSYLQLSLQSVDFCISLLELLLTPCNCSIQLYLQPKFIVCRLISDFTTTKNLSLDSNFRPGSVHLLSAHFTSKSSESSGLLDCDTPLNFYHLLYLVQLLIMCKLRKWLMRKNVSKENEGISEQGVCFLLVKTDLQLLNFRLHCIQLFILG